MTGANQANSEYNDLASNLTSSSNYSSKVQADSAGVAGAGAGDYYKAKAHAKPKTLCLMIALLCSASISLMCEGVLFNHIFFRYHLGDFKTLGVPLPFNEQLQTYAQVVDPKNPQLMIDGFDLPTMTLGFSVVGNRDLLEGRVLLRDDGALVQPVIANSVKVVPTSERDYRVLLISNGNAHSVGFSFVGLKAPIAITSITINAEPKYYFNAWRCVLIFAVLALVSTIFTRQLYRLRLQDLSSKGFWGVQALCYGVCLAVSVNFFMALHPSKISSYMLFDFNEHGFAQLGNKNQSLLLDFPQTQADLEFHDPYVKTLDALNKGQLNLDVVVEPKLIASEHPYDPGVRQSTGADGYWDHSYYKGKYYSYYGYGPVFTLYYPIYWLTGKVPSPTLATFILTVMLISSMFWAFTTALRFFALDRNSNALLFFVAEVATVFGCHIYVNQNFLTFYSYAPALAAAYISAMLALLYTLPRVRRPWVKRVLLALIGVCVVMIVLTRPLHLVWVCALSLPFFYQLCKSKVQPELKSTNVGAGAGTGSKPYTIKDKVLDALAIGVPVAIGAVFTMVTNYLRFDSIFEFGQRYCTGLENFLYNRFYFSLDLLSSTLYLYFFKGFNQIKDFPFFTISRDYPADFGNFQYGDAYLGVFGSPVWYALLLIPLLWCSKTKLKERTTEPAPAPAPVPASAIEPVNLYGLDRENLFRVTITLLAVLLPVVFYLQFQVAAFTIRYVTENLVVFALFNLLLLCRFVLFADDMPLQAKLLYAMVIYALVITIAMEFFAAYNFIETSHSYLNPEALVEAKEFFTPWSTVR